MSPIGKLFLEVVTFDRRGITTSDTIRVLNKMSGGSRWYCERLLAMSIDVMSY
jgi:hypothetical protein